MPYLLDSVSWEEGLLEEDFPYGNIGMGNRLKHFLKEENVIKRSRVNTFLIQQIRRFKPWFPMLSGYGFSYLEE